MYFELYDTGWSEDGRGFFEICCLINMTYKH